MSGPRVLLVTTGAANDGRGHVARELALATALVGAGARVSMRMLRGSLTDAQASLAGALGVLVAEERTAAETESGWSGNDAVVVDLPDPNEVADRLADERLVVFDDREHFRGRAAIVVQPSLAAWSGPARADRVLAGYTWAPLRPGLRRAAGPRGLNTRDGLVVCFGGSDPADVASRLVPLVADAIRPSVAPSDEARRAGDLDLRATSVIVGSGYAGALRPGPSWSVLRDPVDIDRRLAGSTVALIGAGTMKLELALLGVPTVSVAVADDQLAVGPPFAATGATRFLGDGRSIDPSLVAREVAGLLDDEPARQRMTAAGRATIDGRGAERLAAVILELAEGRTGDAGTRA